MAPPAPPPSHPKEKLLSLLPKTHLQAPEAKKATFSETAEVRSRMKEKGPPFLPSLYSGNRVGLDSGLFLFLQVGKQDTGGVRPGRRPGGGPRLWDTCLPCWWAGLEGPMPRPWGSLLVHPLPLPAWPPRQELLACLGLTPGPLTPTLAPAG